jgi:hypothetical protein
MAVFDLKKFLVENKITRNSKLRESDDFEFTDLDKDLAHKLSNEVELQTGDIITPDMWDKQKFINDNWFGEEGWFGLEVYNKTIQDSYLIQSMFFAEEDEDFEADWIVSLNSTTTGKSFNIIGDSTPLKILNSLLKDNYEIYPSNMNESDDFEFTDTDNDLADKMSNEVELKIGDTITPDMWDKQKFIFGDGDNTYWFGTDNRWFGTKLYNETIQDSYLIQSMSEEGGNTADWLVSLKSTTTGESWGLTDIPEKLSTLNDVLKDNYKIINPDMNESDDFEFTDTDKDLAMGLDSFPIIIELINEYTFSEGGDGITLYEVKTTETDSYELEKILQLDVSYDKEFIETLLKDQYFENDDLMEFLNEGKITQSIPDEYYGDDWDNEWEEFDIKVILP